MINEKLQLTDEFYDYADELEKEWKQSMPKLTDKELLAIFPEAKEIIPEKLKEREKEKTEIIDTIKKQLILIKNKTSDELSRYFWRQWVKATEGAELLKTEKHITRLKRLAFVSSGKVSKNSITEEQIQMALRKPIENLINKPMRKSGNKLVGLCPFHREKHPSFYIYTETNSYFCFGCNQGGNAINFARLLYSYSFKEAVEYLIK